MNILKNTEKLIQTEKPEPLLEIEDEGVLLILTFKNNEQELFYLERDQAIETAKRIKKILEEEALPKTITISAENSIEDISKFKGILVIDDTLRTIRLINPEEIPGKDD